MSSQTATCCISGSIRNPPRRDISAGRPGESRDPYALSFAILSGLFRLPFQSGRPVMMGPGFRRDDQSILPVVLLLLPLIADRAEMLVDPEDDQDQLRTDA